MSESDSDSKPDSEKASEIQAGVERDIEAATQDTAVRVFTAIQGKLKEAPQQTTDQYGWIFEATNNKSEPVELSLRTEWDEEEDKIAFLVRHNKTTGDIKHYSIYLGEKGKLRLEGFEPRPSSVDTAHIEGGTLEDYMEIKKESQQRAREAEREVGMSIVAEEEAKELAQMIQASELVP